MKTLILVLSDQLSHTISSLSNIGAHDTVLMCELMEEVTYVKHHPKKIALWFAAMRHFSEELKCKGVNMRYIKLTDPANSHTLTSEVTRAINDLNIKKIVVAEPGEYRLKKIIESWQESLKICVEFRIDNRFLCNLKEFKIWAGSKTQFRMEYFYRYMRKKYHILIEPDGQPTGGLWNYDKQNRKSPSSNLSFVKRISHKKSLILQEVLMLVKEMFIEHFGDLEPFHYAITREQALLELEHFIDYILPNFGDYQDAMIKGEAYLNHSLLSSYINIGLLLPYEVCKKAEIAYRNGKVKLNDAEGFIRQILGWREFLRGIYWHKMPDYGDLNYLEAKNPLPSFYWGAKTSMLCVAEAVLHTKIHAYSHHIQRLMVTGNFALIARLDVKQVQEWYLAVYSDAYEWVEMPNTLGMALFGDGGIVGSKPYAASGKYIDKMSNFCKSCCYNPKETFGDNACPFNALYWDFLSRNREKLENNHRLSFIYNTLDKFDIAKKQAIRSKGSNILIRMEEGKL